MNYFKEAERVLTHRNSLDKALENLISRRAHLMSKGAPHDIGGMDYSQPYVEAGTVNDTMQDCLDLIEVQKEIASTQAEIKLIDSVIDQLTAQSKKLVILWYIQAKPKEQIREELERESSTTIYTMRNKAVGEFALLYFGAGAMSSV